MQALATGTRGAAAQHWDEEKSGVLQEILRMLEWATGVRYNYCLLNYYKDGTRNIGAHADDERDLEPGSSIASVSLGAVRRFRFRPKTRAPGAWLRPAELRLANGSLLIMGGRTQ